MLGHSFPFKLGVWLGEGQVKLNLIKDPMKFYSRWTITKEDSTIMCVQEIEVIGLSERMHNHFIFDFSKIDDIQVELENVSIGKMRAKGLLDKKMFAWEYISEPGEFGGYEIYEKQDEKTYQFRAHFITAEHLRSFIKGKMWLSNSE